MNIESDVCGLQSNGIVKCVSGTGYVSISISHPIQRVDTFMFLPHYIHLFNTDWMFQCPLICISDQLQFEKQKCGNNARSLLLR
jgi:hypothetical protein